jgi:hypothetical protein
LKKIVELRESGEIVILDFNESSTNEDRHELGCDRKLVLVNEQWQIQALEQ